MFKYHKKTLAAVILNSCGLFCDSGLVFPLILNIKYQGFK